MTKDLDNLEEDDKLDELDDFSDDSAIIAAPVIQDYSERRVLVWEEDDSHREACVEVLSDLLVGVTIKDVKTEAEAIEQLDNDDWDTFVVDFYTEGVSASEYIKRVNNYPGSILVAINMGPLTLPDERDSAKTEVLRRLFDIERINTQIRN